MAKRGKITLELKIDRAKERIAEKPENALREIGKICVSEIRKVTPRKTGYLRKSLQYWYRRKDKDLQIGFKAWYSVPLILGNLGGKANSFFMQKMMELTPEMQKLISQALKELEKEE